MSSSIRKLWQALLGLGIPFDMLLSVAVTVGWLAVVAAVSGEARSVFVGAVFFLFPLALIWFRDPLSEVVGSCGFHQINAESPPGLVAFFGWLGLIALIWMSAQELFQ